jgi:spore coat polysaccharide biosynthesis protein SpsF
MNLRPGIILQARHASSRLPGKALATIGPRTILQHCLRRLLATGVARIVLATTTNAEDDALAAIGERAGVAVFRGSSEDVLGRFAAAAERYELDPVIRATADNPAVDPSAASRLLNAIRRSQADYACETGLPVGAALEIMTAPALHYAASAATSLYDREHVTTFIKSHPHTFHIAMVPAPAALTAPDLRLTVDTPQDLEWVRELFQSVGSHEPTVSELIATARRVRQEVA